MDWVKSLIDATNDRVKNPMIGSIIISFLAANWKAIFFLCFSRVSVADRFAFFDNNTTWISLLLIPLGFGIIFTIVNPWMKLLILEFTKIPEQKSKLLQLKLINERLKIKQEYETARRNIVASLEVDLIEAAKRDQEVLELENEELKKGLQETLEEIRAINNQDVKSMVIPPDIDSSSTIDKTEQLKELLAIYDTRAAKARTQGDFDDEELYKQKATQILKKIEAYTNNRL